MNLINRIFEAGIVGCGGAGFPTHIKLGAKVNYLIINGVECEPLLRTDRYLMIHYAEKLLLAIEEVGKLLSAKEIHIALKETYYSEIDCLETVIAKMNSSVRIFKMNNFYPAGDEQMIVCDVTGKTVPPGGIPLDVNSVVLNVATMICIFDAINGKNFTHKYLTINGEVNNPIILNVPIGTSLRKCIELAGGPCLNNYKVIVGGPLMGKILKKDELNKTFITKTTSGLIVISDENYLSKTDEINLKHMLNRARSSCIQCSYCTQMCPRYLTGHMLQPHRIMRKLAYSISFEDILDDEDVKQAMICCECGICELYACPMELQPRRVNALLKSEFVKRGIRYKKGNEEYSKLDERKYRLIPSKRIATKVGLGNYYDINIDELLEYTPERVEISLKQHIGNQAKPEVMVGDKVKCGQLIGSCDQDKMGANIHASIDGIVIEIGDSIVIEKQ